MDALAELIRDVRLDSAIYFNAEFSSPWRLSSPESRRLAPVLDAGDAHVIIYHLLCEGTAYAELDGGERVTLTAGDLVTFPHGHGHTLGHGRAAAQAIDAATALATLTMRDLGLLKAGGGGADRSHFICGFLLCDPHLCQGFLSGLPPIVKVSIRDDPSGQWLENSLRFSVTQAANREAGAGPMLAKLSEAVFAETLRRYARGLPDGQTGWFGGARDADVGRALALLHRRHAHPWTVADLAREVGVSRSVLSERFRHLVGEPPMTYLARWRLRLAARALATTSRGVADIAAEVGYDSEAAFNRAFKREHGVPPARYRRERAARATTLV